MLRLAATDACLPVLMVVMMLWRAATYEENHDMANADNRQARACVVAFAPSRWGAGEGFC